MSVIIKSKRERSRWRCGHEFTREPQEFASGHFNDEQIQRLRDDPVLDVTVIDEPQIPTANDSHATIDAFAETLLGEYPHLGQFIGKDHRDLWTKEFKIAAIKKVLAGDLEPFNPEPENPVVSKPETGNQKVDVDPALAKKEPAKSKRPKRKRAKRKPASKKPDSPSPVASGDATGPGNSDKGQKDPTPEGSQAATGSGKSDGPHAD